MIWHIINLGKPRHLLHLSNLVFPWNWKDRASYEVLVNVFLKGLQENSVIGMCRGQGRAWQRCQWHLNNQNRRLLLKNTRRAASGVHLGAKGSNVWKKKISTCNQGLCNCHLRRRRVVKYYGVNDTLSISNKKNPFISINPSQQAQVGPWDNVSFALFNLPWSILEPICFNSSH